MIGARVGNTIRRPGRRPALALAVAALVLAVSGTAWAAMAVNKVILDFRPGQPRRSDVEVLNTGKERLYVVVEPARIEAPGTPQQRRVRIRDPQRLGLLVTPNKLILEPGQRKIVRFAVLAPAGSKERIYRVTIRPAVGRLIAKRTAIKVVVAYDLLVILRPARLQPNLTARRSGRTITFRNSGNTNALLFNGKQCDRAGKKCQALPVKRMYANTVWTLKLRRNTPVEYYVRVGESTVKRTY